MPKQFVTLYNHHSLLQNTILRIKPFLKNNSLFILTNHIQRYLVADQLKEIGIVEADIILEPIARGTAPALLLAAFEAFRQNPSSRLLVVSSDSDVQDVKKYQEILHSSEQMTRDNKKIVLFGAKPTYPETGYGYLKPSSTIRTGKHNVEMLEIERFVEKPSLTEAQALISSGNLWNSGFYIVPCKLYIEEMKIHAPEIFALCSEAYTLAHKFMDREVGYNIVTVDEGAFQKLPDISVDVALLEKTKNVATVEVDIGWSDVGSWKSIYEIRDKDSNGNIIDVANAVPINSKNIMLISKNKEKLFATINVENISVIDTEDALLILNTNDSQDVRKVVSSLKFEDKGIFLKSLQKMSRWGHMKTLLKDGSVTVKKLTIKPGKSYHSNCAKKNTQFVILKGQLSLHNKTPEYVFRAEDTVFFKKDEPYTFINISDSKYAEIIKIEY